MSKLTEAQKILAAFGLPKQQQNERSALTLLALCNLKEIDKWKSSQKISMAVVGNKDNAKYEGVMRFIAEHYNKKYAENSLGKHFAVKLCTNSFKQELWNTILKIHNCQPIVRTIITDLRMPH